ncbi:MAG: MBL fold metallo-hydrolase [Nitrososphaerales archaeon]
MEVRILGAAREVGRSAILLKSSNTNILLDFGVLMQREIGFPVHVQPRDLDAILLSHAHLDHSGALPLFYLSNGPRIYTTPLTLELTRLLIEDLLRVSGFYLPFEYLDLLEMIKKITTINPNDRVKISSFDVAFYDAGHIPGSVSILLEGGGKRILYTGDINDEDTQLLRGADYEIGELDLLVIESTYATEDHPPRSEVEKTFVEYAKEVVERGGTLFVPAFSVGRAQEIACTLSSHRFPYPTYMDGMALKTNEILFRYPEYLRDYRAFRRAINNVEVVTAWRQRKQIINTPSVIISPAGMLVGGAAVFYNQQIAQREKNAIAIVAYQVQGTPGRTLLEKGLALVNGKPTKVKAEIKRFDFSSHSGKSGLMNLLRKVKGNPKVLMVHGEEPSCVSFAKNVKEIFGFEAHAPKPNESFQI